MDAKVLNNIRRSLTARKENLRNWLGGNGDKKLSWAAGEQEEAKIDNVSMMSRIDEVLANIEDGRYGKCEKCDGEVEAERLVLDFTTCICLDHYTEEERRELENDLELAAKVQKHLLPAGIPALSGIQMAVMAKPARIVGGDYYDFFRYQDQLQGIVIADVMGKGVPASMLMANLQASLRILGPESKDLDVLAVRLNELFRFNLKLIRFITLFIGAINIDQKRLYYCNAGHNPPILWKSRSNSFQLLKPTGPAIGLVPKPLFRSESIQLEKEDLLLLYTDGLVEARNLSQEEYAQDRVLSYLHRHAAEPVETILNGLTTDVVSFAGRFNDDLTMMLLKMD